MSEKCCTFKVKFSDVQPLDVKFSDVQVAGSKKGAVLYDREQSLTEEEQAQARGNIGAVSGDEVDEAIDEFADEVQTALEDKITSPQTAAVGDVLTVEEVNEDGKPVKWKGIDKIPTDNLPVLGRYEGFDEYDCVGMICNVVDSIELTGANPTLYKLCKLIPRFAQHGNEGLGYSDGAVNLMTTRDVKIHTQTTEADFQNIDYSANIYLDHGGEMDEKWGLTKEDFPIISYPLNQTGFPPRWTHLVYTASGKIYRTSNAVTSAYGDKYTAVLMNPQPTIELDETLTESGKAADSKAVGEKFAEIEDEYATRLDEITDTLDSVDEVLSEHGEKISSNSEKITELEEKVDGHGNSEKPWRKAIDYMALEDLVYVTFMVDDDGNELEFDEAFIGVMTSRASGESSNGNFCIGLAPWAAGFNRSGMLYKLTLYSDVYCYTAYVSHIGNIATAQLIDKWRCAAALPDVADSDIECQLSGNHVSNNEYEAKSQINSNGKAIVVDGKLRQITIGIDANTNPKIGAGSKIAVWLR